MNPSGEQSADASRLQAEYQALISISAPAAAISAIFAVMGWILAIESLLQVRPMTAVAAILVLYCASLAWITLWTTRPRKNPRLRTTAMIDSSNDAIESKSHESAISNDIPVQSCAEAHIPDLNGDLGEPAEEQPEETERQARGNLERTHSSAGDEASLALGDVPETQAVQALMEELSKAKASLQRSEEQLRYLAYHDAVTGLPNRAFLVERLSDMLGEASRNDEKAGLLFIDLDHFKVVNDSLGHSVGDQVLKSVADRLTNAARQQDIVARLGGDEFVVVMRNIKDTSDAGMAADRIKRLISQEIFAQQHRLINTCSIGISVFPNNGTDAETLIKNADAALFAAKEKGRSTWQFFTADMNQKAVERLTLENALRQASLGDELYVEYQPQVELATGMVVGAEALLRWRHPRLGLVSPSRFIPVAENTGEILRIGEWVLKSACAQARQWEREGRPRLTMAVNVSAVQFRHPSFLETVHETLAESGVKAERLELEVTESQLMDNPEMMMVLLRKLREMGAGLAIDDFGIGYCGLSYLRHFQFTRLKIDQSFVRSVMSDPRDAALTASIVNMARVLKMKVIAECVETAEQLQLLHSLGCHQIQGYYFSPPVSADEFAQKFLGGQRRVAHLQKENRIARPSAFKAQ